MISKYSYDFEGEIKNLKVVHKKSRDKTDTVSFSIFVKL